MRLLWILLLVLLSACGAGPTSAPPAPSPTPVAADPEASAAVPIFADDPVRGDPRSPVTIVVFADFECFFCAKFAATLEEVRDVRVVYKHMPLPSHAHAQLAAEIGEGVRALAGTDAFWKFHDTAFHEQRAIAPETLRAWAAAAGADPTKLEEGLAAGRFAAKVAADVMLARKLEIDGTPAWFVNGKRLGGARPVDAVRAAIAEERAQTAGLAPGDVYVLRAKANYRGREEEEEAEAEADEAAEAKLVYKVPVGSGPAQGPKGALVTIVLFSDFECPYCKRFSKTLAEVRRAYGEKVRVVWRDLPARYHEHAEPAAQLARAARAQRGDEGFWQAHDALFAATSLTDLEAIARDANLDVAKAMTAVKTRAFRKAIDEDFDVSDDFQAVGTPHSFINGHRVVGAKPFDKLKPLIDAEIARASALVAAGTAPEALYDALVADGKTPLPPPEKAIAAPKQPAPFRGAANAPVVIHEVADFQCPYCKRANATMDELLEAFPGKIKIVWRDHPLERHKDAQLAAEAAREAYAQKGNEGFTRMERLLFENQNALAREDLDRYAKVIGLDAKKFAAALDGRKHKATVEADDKLAEEAGVSGAPAFFVGPYFVGGAAPYGKFRKLVELTLKAKK